MSNPEVRTHRHRLVTIERLSNGDFLLFGKLWRRARIDSYHADEAAQNRQRIKEGYATAFWREVEATLRGVPVGKPLPKGVPTGRLPEVHRKQTQGYYAPIKDDSLEFYMGHA